MNVVGRASICLQGSNGSRAEPPVRKKELLELAPAGTFAVGLREGQENWEGLPLPTRQQSLTTTGQSEQVGSLCRETPWG